jgi:hypothetical protein
MTGVLIASVLFGVVAAVAAIGWFRRSRAKVPTYLGLFDSSRLPESIRLVALERKSIFVSEWIERTSAALIEQGYEDAGFFTFQGSRNLTIRLLAHSGHSVHAALYDHETTGRWLDVTTHYANGDQVTYTTRAGVDRDPAPGHRVIQVRGVGVYAPHARMCTERPMGVFKSVSGANVATVYENGWSLWLEWKRGTSRSAAAA